MGNAWAFIKALPQVISLLKSIFAFIASLKEARDKAAREAQDKIDEENLKKYKETVKDGKTQSEIDSATSDFLNGN